MALIRYKWNRFGRKVYIAVLITNLVFLTFLSLYTLFSPAPYSSGQIIEHTRLSAKFTYKDENET